MNAHDFAGTEDECAVCQRPPGNYIHIGLSDEDIEGQGWARSMSRGLTEITPPPVALLASERAAGNATPPSSSGSP